MRSGLPCSRASLRPAQKRRAARFSPAGGTTRALRYWVGLRTELAGTQPEGSRRGASTPSSRPLDGPPPTGRGHRQGSAEKQLHYLHRGAATRPGVLGFRRCRTSYVLLPAPGDKASQGSRIGLALPARMRNRGRTSGRGPQTNLFDTLILARHWRPPATMLRPWLVQKHIRSRGPPDTPRARRVAQRVGRRRPLPAASSGWTSCQPPPASATPWPTRGQRYFLSWLQGQGRADGRGEGLGARRSWA